MYEEGKEILKLENGPKNVSKKRRKGKVIKANKHDLAILRKVDKRKMYSRNFVLKGREIKKNINKGYLIKNNSESYIFASVNNSFRYEFFRFQS